MIYEEEEYRDAITFLGTTGVLPATAVQDPSNSRMHYSQASLQAVTSLQVFLGDKSPDGKSRRCRGILFRYRGGGERAVGECRHHVDPVETYSNPTGLYIFHHQLDGRISLQIPPQHYQVQVQVQTGDSRFTSDDHGSRLEADGWKYVPFDSDYILKFSFTNKFSYLDPCKLVSSN